MKTEVKDPLNLSRKEVWRLSLGVLQLLDGLSVGEAHCVLKESALMMNSRTLHDFSSAGFQQAAEELQAIPD